MSWYLRVWRKATVFSGRARRKEYWYFYLFNFLALILLAVLDRVLDPRVDALRLIYSLAVLVPHVAVSVRRMHDSDHRGWWLLFPIVNLVLLISPGTHGTNRFGEDPLIDDPIYRAPMAPAGWHPDPSGRHQYRYWDSLRWTSSVSDNGMVSIDEP